VLSKLWRSAVQMSGPPLKQRRREMPEGVSEAIQRRLKELPEGDSYYPDASGKLGEWQLPDGSKCHPRDCGAQPAGKRFCVWVEPSSNPRCWRHHEMVRHEKNPEYYANSACCDICGLPDLVKICSHFFHCPACKFDQCPACSADVVQYKPQRHALIEVLQDTSAMVAASRSGGLSDADAWRVWSAAPTVARYLEAHLEVNPPKFDGPAQRPVALELGAGSALVSFVLARFGHHHVIATDRRHVLPLMHDGFDRNFEKRFSCTAPACAPRCPAHPGTLAKASAMDEGECNVCGQSATGMRSCHACGFRLCEDCAAVCGNDSRCPAWYRMCCQALPVSADARGLCAHVQETSGMFLRPLDWTMPEDVAALRNEMDAAGLSPPSLIVASDAVTSAKHAGDFVKTVLLLREWVRTTPRSSTLLLGIEKREPTGLFKAFRKCGVVLQIIPSHEVIVEGRGLVGVWQADLGTSRACGD